MDHSIAARYAAYTGTRFPRPSVRARERRLGLRAAPTFTAVSHQATILRTADLSPLVRLRASWRAVVPATPSRRGGQPRPAVAMTWPRSARTGTARRPSAAPAPWRA
jgi:hypothetical protein